SGSSLPSWLETSAPGQSGTSTRTRESGPTSRGSTGRSYRRDRRKRSSEGSVDPGVIGLADRFGAHNYHPLPIVVARAEGCWVYDPEGKRYLDMLSSYSALNQGHRHPRIIQALKDQADKVTLTSRAFHNELFGPFCEKLCRLAGMEMALLMNSGAEAVETAIKTARKWGYMVKKVARPRAEIIVCENNFHGRTTTIVGMSSEPQYKDD